MPSVTLNEKIIKKLVNDKSEWGKKYYDKKNPCFGIRISKSGTASFILRYRYRGHDKCLTIGRYPAWSYVLAIEEARKLSVEISKGNDPLGDRNKKLNSPTVNDLWEEYCKNHQSKTSPHSVKDQNSIWKKYIQPRLGNKFVDQVDLKDIQKIHRDITAEGKTYRANRVYEVVRRLFNIAKDHLKWRLDNPAIGIKKNPEEPRERYLTEDELSCLKKALDNHNDQKQANIVRLLLMTGARKGEVLSAEWTMFDFDKGVWIKPSSHTKQRKLHRVPLSPQALQRLQKIRQTTNSKFVFPQNDNPEDHVKDIKKFWRNICKIAGIKNLRIHDLRHSYASFLVSNGQSLPVIGRLLGHSQVSTTQRYAHLMDAPLREATNQASQIMKF